MKHRDPSSHLRSQGALRQRVIRDKKKALPERKQKHKKKNHSYA